MERVVHKSTEFADARAWDLEQHISMTSEERQQAARELRDRVFGTNVPDVREAEREK